ncbi:MAG: ATP-binding protein, partial [Desulfurella sp.]
MDILFYEILNFALSKKLFYKNQKIGIGVSGGGDSVLLFYFFKNIQKEFNLDLVVLHFNHKIRPDSDDDEVFVENLAKKHNVYFFSDRADVL